MSNVSTWRKNKSYEAQEAQKQAERVRGRKRVLGVISTAQEIETHGNSAH